MEGEGGGRILGGWFWWGERGAECGEGLRVEVGPRASMRRRERRVGVKVGGIFGHDGWLLVG